MTSLVTPNIERIHPYQPGTPIEEVARRGGRAPLDIVKLASNENPLGPSPLAVEAARAELSKVHRYPESEAPLLRAALAEHLQVPREEILLGNGSNELLELLVRTFCSGDQHVVFAEPSFVVYRLACLAHGVPFTEVALNDSYEHDLAAMAHAVGPGTRLVFIANPNNPTGTHVGRSVLSGFLERLPADVIVVLDEAYAEYADASDYPDGLELRRSHDKTVVVRTFSKIYGLAGLRLGYAVMPRELASYVNRIRAPFNVNSIAQAAGVAALRDREHVERSRALNRAEKAFMERGLGRLGLRVVPSQANFLLVDVARPAGPVYEALLVHGVIVRPLPPLPSMLRITLGMRAENERCLAALQAVLE